MTTIVTRAGKGSPLTHTEVDTNFTNLNTNKLETAAIPLGTAAAPSISFLSDANTGIYSPGADQVAVATNGTQRITIDSSGRLLAGTATARRVGVVTAGFELIGDVDKSAISSSVYSNDSSGPYLSLGKSRGVSDGSYTIVTANDQLGNITFSGADGSTLNSIGASITANVDGTPGANDMPGRLVFSTTADSGSSPSERLRITSAGLVGIGSTAPSQLLEIKGANARFAVNSTTVADGGILLQGNGTTYAEIKLDASSGILDIAQKQAAGNITFSTGTTPTERIKITSGGFFKVKADTTYQASTSDYHEFNSATNSVTLNILNKHASYTSPVLNGGSDRAASSAYDFENWFSSYSGSFDLEFRLRGDGNGLCDGAWTGGGADYAEYFEWLDGNNKEEDRRGISVVLDGDKIREAVAGEDPIGVISGNPSVVGDAAWNKWSGKYLRDEFGTYIQEDYEVTDDDGNTVTQQRRKLNPAYDPEAEYIPREQRPEWDCVGLMGKLRIRKGQVTGSRWIKMRDISDSVEEWLVR